MAIFLIPAPSGPFPLLMLVPSAAASLFASAAICLTVVASDILRGRSIKTPGAGAALRFIALGGDTMLVDVLSSPAVKLTVDAGVFGISLASLAIRRPFTLQYAREMVDSETARLPGLMKSNYIITWAWTAAFLLMMMANVLMRYVPGLPLWSGLAIAFAARNTAVYFSKWYPQHRRAKEQETARYP